VYSLVILWRSSWGVVGGLFWGDVVELSVVVVVVVVVVSSAVGENSA